MVDDSKSMLEKLSATQQVLREVSALREVTNLRNALKQTNMLQDAMKQANSGLAALQPFHNMRALQNFSATKALPPITPRVQKPELPGSLMSKATPIDTISIIGNAIRNARKSKNLNQQNFADLAGVGRRFLSELESGKPTLEIGKVLQVAKAAGLQLAIVNNSDE